MKERIVGHRGFGVLAPENTLLALEKAAEAGLHYVEFDVRLTKDHIPIIAHDDSLIRCAHKGQLISETNYVDLEDVNIASHFALASLDARIPTLEEYLVKAKSLNLHCQIELKPNKGDETSLPEIVIETMDAFYVDAPYEALPLITSFVPESLKVTKSLTTTPYPTGVLVKTGDTPDWENYAKAAECNFVHVNALYLTDEIAADIRDKGYKINAYHLNHPEIARQAIERGCERFTCDIPDVFLEE